MNSRHTPYPVDPQFLNRWSPRAFTSEEIPEEKIMTAFDAAHWSPSSGNSQPWRFVYARRGSASWNTFLDFLVDGNRLWAQNAAALVVVLSKKDTMWGGKLVPSPTHSFDSGSAWMSFALQLEKEGWATHGMAGIFHEKIRTQFNLAENFAVEMMIAVGRRGERDSLPEQLQAREAASERLPLAAVVHEGEFPEEWRRP